MNKTQMVVEHVRTNPGATNQDIKALLGVDRNTAAAITSNLYTRGKLTREQIGATASNVPIYGYYPADPQAVRKVGRPRKTDKTTKSIRKTTTSDNGLNHLVNVLADALVAQITDRVKSKLTEQLSAVMSLPAPEMLRAGPVEVLPPAEPEKVRLPKVGIVGLLPAQAGLISHEYGQAFDLSFPESIGQMKVAAINCEHVFVMKFNGHSTWDNVKNGRCEAVFIHGGMSELRNRLAALHKEYM